MVSLTDGENSVRFITCCAQHLIAPSAPVSARLNLIVSNTIFYFFVIIAPRNDEISQQMQNISYQMTCPRTIQCSNNFKCAERVLANIRLALQIQVRGYWIGLCNDNILFVEIQFKASLIHGDTNTYTNILWTAHSVNS